MPADAAFSHTTAAFLLGLPGTGPDGTHVTVSPGTSRGSRQAIKWHKADLAGAIVQVKGVPCTSPLRTWLDLGAMLPLPELVAATDCALRRRLLAREELVVPSGVRGAVALREARLIADPRSLSPRESVLRVHLHKAGLPAPEVNVDIIINSGWVACADLAWPRYRVIVEYDGQHHSSDRQRHQDARTRNELADQGWQVRVLTAWHLNHVEQAVTMIRDLLKAQGWAG